MLRAGLSALAALFLGACIDNPIAPGRTGRLLIQPVFDGSALFAPLAIDNLRLIVVRPPSEVLKTITQPFPANANQVTITATDIQLESNAEDLLVTIELYAGANLLFTGTQTVTVAAGITPQPASIPMLYQGPGSNLVALTLAPRDTTVRPGAVFTYQVTAADAQQQPVTSFYVGWQVSAGTITGTGQFTAPATRDTITITVSAPAPNTTKDSTRVFVIAAPGSLTITGGDAQTALVGSRLPQLLAVRVNGTDNLPLPGVVVNFAATTGGGSVDSATATTDAQGIARTGATLGSTVGQQTFTASSTGLASVVFAQTATAVVGGIVWDGSVSNAWTDPNNWTPAVVPGLADNVTIPAGPSIQPVVSITANMNDLTIATGATVTLSGSFTFNVVGNLAANGGLVVSSGTPTIQLSGTAKTLVGNIASATITGTVALAGNTSVSGNVAVSGGTASLDIGIGAMQVGGGFSTGSGGRLVMTTGGGQLNIQGSAAFGGRDETGFLTAGTITIGGNFSQTGSGSATSFAPSGTHLTGFVGAAATHTVNFGTPGAAAAGSHFMSLDIGTTGTVSLGTEVYVDGQLISAPVATPPTLGTTGVTHKLNATSVNVTGMVVNQATITIGGGAIVAFNSVQFSNSPTTLAQLAVNNPGAATPFTFTSLSFATTPVAPNGFYLDATDTDGATSGVLTINMVGATPAVGAPFIRTAGGAVVNWPPAPPVKAWTGAISTDWSDPGNWSPAGVPVSLDVVTIGPTTNQPTLTASSVASTVIISGNGGRLTIGGQTLTLGNLTTHTDGLLVMTNAADLVIVGGAAVFQGGDETGLLSAGELRLAGDFNQQDQTNTRSFFASGTHRVVFTGAVLQGVRFCCTAGASGFRELDISNSAGINIQFSGNGVFVYDTLISQVGAGPAPLLYTLGQTLTAARFRVDKLIVDRGTLTLNEGGVPATQQLDNVTFQNFLTTFTQLAVVAPGGVSGPRTLTFNNLLFQPLSAGNTGRYLNVTAPSGTLILDLPGASPAGGNGPAFTTTSGAVTVNWPAAPVKTWTGALTGDWNTAGNWSPAGVPTSADDVTIPGGTPFQPVLSQPAAVAALSGSVGANLDLAGFVLSVNGHVNWQGTMTPVLAGSFLQLQGPVQFLQGNLSRALVLGSYTLLGATTLGGDIEVGSGGTIFVNGNTLGIAGALVISGSGTFQMTDPGDVVTVQGSATFGGADLSIGFLTAGALLVGGDFTQLATSSGDSYHPSGIHSTQFGPGNHTITFATPGNVPGTSHFQEAQWGGGGTLTLNSDVYAHGPFQTSSLSGAMVSSGAGRLLSVGSYSGASTTTFNNVRVAINAPTGGALALDNIVFQGLPTTATQLTVTHNGAGGPFTFGNLTFAPTPTTGLYLSATDADGATSGVLTINVLGASPPSGAPFFQTTNGAVINWPPIGGNFTWTGAVSTDWSVAGNWSPAQVPGVIDNVTLVPITNQPVLTTNVGINNLTSNTGSILDLNGFVLAASGSVDLTGSITGTGTAGVVLTGTGQTLRGTINADLAVIGSYALNGNLITNANLSVQGSLDISSFTAQVGGSFITLNNGVLVMTTSGGLLDVGLDAIFTGGSTDGLLTAGTLRIARAFDQIGINSPRSFAANPGHLTIMGLGGFGDTVDISFTTPGPTLSHFGDLREDLFGATFRLGTDVVALGTLSGGDGFGGTLLGTICPVVFTVTMFSTSGPLNLDCVQLVVNDPGGTNNFGINGVTFANLPTNVTQLTIRHPGLAAGNFTTGFLTFVQLTTGDTGFYIQVEDTDAVSPLLSVLPSGTNVTNGPSFTTLVGGGTVTWP